MAWQDFLNNLQNTNNTIGDSTDIAVDRLKQMNPNVYGPPTPSTPLPQEMALSNLIGQGVMGIASPAGKVTSAPWMKNLTEGTVNAAVPAAEGLANSAKDTIYTQAAKAAQKFQALKNKLSGN